jgi:3-deoxy-D-manno-octulosonic acid kinase
MHSTLERFKNGAAIIDRELTDDSLDHLFEPPSDARKSLARGRGQAWQIQGGFGTAALRHYTRGGLLAPIMGDCYWFAGAERTRAFAEFRLLQQVCIWQLPAPQPIAARFVRSGLIYRADLLTAWLPGARPLSDFVAKADAALFTEVGSTIARFHALGVDHADLNAHNVIVTDKGVALLDFDRSVIRKLDRSTQGLLVSTNLQRLKRSLTKLGFAAREDFDAKLWPALENAHQDMLVK